MGLRCWQAREADRARTDGSAAAVLAGREDGAWTVLLCWEGNGARTAARGGRGGEWGYCAGLTWECRG